MSYVYQSVRRLARKLQACELPGWTIPQKFHATNYRRFTVFPLSLLTASCSWPCSWPCSWLTHTHARTHFRPLSLYICCLSHFVCLSSCLSVCLSLPPSVPPIPAPTLFHAYMFGVIYDVEIRLLIIMMIRLMIPTHSALCS